MASRTAPQPPFSTFGWSLTGALLIALSLPPLGMYPLAWVALVPFIARWAATRPGVDYVREVYALLLTASCCVGFWLLFNPNPATAAMGGLSLFLVPVPLVVAFVAAHYVKDRIGLYPGLAALALNLIAAEFLTLRFNLSVPWLLLGHTQADAVEFIQMADVGGVLLLSLWVFLLNVTAFLALPRVARPGERYGERGASVAVFTALVALPVAYGSIRTAQSDVPSGYTRVGIVQPGVPPGEWDRQSPATKVDHLVTLSEPLLGQDFRPAPAVAPADVAQPAPLRIGEEPGPAVPAAPVSTQGPAPVPADASPNLLIWPQTSLPFMGTDRGEAELYERLERWVALRDVALLTGAQTATEGVDRQRGQPDDADLANSAVLLRPGQPIERYDQMRRVPFADIQSKPGSDRVLFEAGDTEIAATLGFESLYGDHVRRFTERGADLIVVLSRNDVWGRTAGLYQHLQFTRLRAIESRRSVVLSTVSGISAVIYPSGRIDEVAGWMDSGVLSMTVPTYRGETFYVRHGDWLGAWALGLALIFGFGTLALSVYAPELLPQRRPAPRPRVAMPSGVYG